MRDKYTATYFTGRDADGNVVPHGADGYDAFLRGQVREQDSLILTQLSFTGQRVLEFGYGRGEAIKFAVEHGARRCEGVDFSDAARALADGLLGGHGITSARLHTADALDFVREFSASDERDGGERFDIVLMLDFVEHVPRHELRELLTLLPAVMAPRCIVVVNTPAFRYDNDTIADGIDPRNHEGSVDTADFCAATAGMHCNKYSVVSLQAFMRDCGYRNISEAHFFVLEESSDPYRLRRSYRAEWEQAREAGYPIVPTYADDTIEYASERRDSPRWQTFSEGLLEGIDVLATDEYRGLAFAGGDYDRELFDDCGTSGIDGKVVFDVGGFMGVSSLLFARMVGEEGRVISLEPNPWNLTRMQRNFSRNHDLGQRIEVHGLALGDSLGKAAWTFSDSLDDGHSSTSRLGNAHATMSFAELRRLGFSDDVVRVTTLDAFVEGLGVVPDIVKVDIEGAEHLLLMGGAHTLAHHSPTLYMEVHSPFCGLLCAELLRDLGYRMEPLLEESDGRVMIKATRTAAATPAGDPEGRRESHAGWLALQPVAPRHETDSPEEENRLLREQLSAANERLNEAQEELAEARLRLPLPELGVRPALRALGGSCERVVRAAVLSGKKRLHWP